MKFISGSTLLLLLPTLVTANTLGIHCWRQEPFSHVLCFEVEEIKARYYSLIGEDIVPAEARYPVRGSALFDETHEVFRLEFTQNLGGTFVFENSVTLDKNTLNGTWSDDSGSSGDFSYLGAGPVEVSPTPRLSKRILKALPKSHANPINK